NQYTASASEITAGALQDDGIGMLVGAKTFGKGEMGAANGMAADGSIIRDNEQAQEVWVGTSFGLAALLLSEGLKDEAFHTAWGVHHVIYESKGYWFRTPEAWDDMGNFRASMYMRPAAVWAMEMTSPASR
ncbi:MAG: GH116 family glycosyl hydrolase, partial [Candidatus Acidiferrales bacterium]